MAGLVSIDIRPRKRNADQETSHASSAIADCSSAMTSAILLGSSFCMPLFYLPGTLLQIRKPAVRVAASAVSHKYLYKELARYLLAPKIIPRSRGRLRSTMICLLHALSSYFRDATLAAYG